jgi:hypothetical protein
MNDPRLEHLLHRHFDQALTAAEREELSKSLLASASAREEFWRMARWNALIRQWGEAEWGRIDAEVPLLRALPPTPSPKKTKPAPASPIWSRIREDFSVLHPRVWMPSVHPRKLAAPTLAAAAVLLCLFLLSRLELLPGNRPAPPASDYSLSNIAVIAKCCDAVWADNIGSRLPGQSLQPGILRLAEGAVQVEFARGARVVIEGPAEFELISDNEAHLKRGKLRAYVPTPAHGFLIRTRDFNITDLGTEFGCVTPQSGSSEVHVFNGSVAFELRGHPETGRQIYEGQALKVTLEKASDIPLNATAFLSEDALAQKELAATVARFNAWKIFSRAWSRNPSTLLHLDFEKTTDWQRSLPNRAHRGLMDNNAAIVGCSWSPGRWTDKQGLHFSNTGDRLRVSVPGLFESLTLLTWIKPDGLSDATQSLLSTESDQPGDIRWSIEGGNTLSFAIRSASPEASEWKNAKSYRLPNKYAGAEWILIGVVYDGGSGRVTHYLNGRPFGTSALPSESPLRLDTFEIGNKGRPGEDSLLASSAPPAPPHLSGGHFRGSMDEFMILSEPLEYEDIVRIFEMGRPTPSPKSPSPSLLRKIP